MGVGPCCSACGRDPSRQLPDDGFPPIDSPVKADLAFDESASTALPIPEAAKVKDKDISSLPPRLSNGREPVEANVKHHPHVSLRSVDGCSSYFLDQSFAIVRHGDRLDHTPDWNRYPDRRRWPNDTPLTEKGHEHARQVGQKLASTGKPFQLIISSPYYRCAQTASRIAQQLGIPIHFDLDLGEVFDNESMEGDIGGKIQHRAPEILKAQLASDFKDVEYICDDASRLKVEGQLPPFPEPFAGARMRFCYKVKKLLQRSASQLMSIIIVTHGDALAAVVGLLRETWSIKDVPYCAHAVASRKVKVLNEGSDAILKEEPVYVDADQWAITMSPGFKYSEVKNLKRKENMHLLHDQEMMAMNAKAAEIRTDYDLDVAHEASFAAALQRLGSSDKDMKHLLVKAKSSNHICKEHSRVPCAPAQGASK